MKTNMGKADRIIRLIIGFVIVALGIIYNSWLGLIGIIPILTAAIGLCGLYVPLGISTCKEEKSKVAQ